MKKLLTILLIPLIFACGQKTESSQSDKVDLFKEPIGKSDDKVPEGVSIYKIGMSLNDFLQGLSGLVELTCEGPSVEVSYVRCSNEHKDGSYLRSRYNMGDFEIEFFEIPLNESVGGSGSFTFYKDRLVDLTISSPSVGLNVLTEKYGKPIESDQRKKTICQNKLGGKFDEISGNMIWEWVGSSRVAKFIRKDIYLNSLLYNRCGGDVYSVFSYVIYDNNFKKKLTDEIEEKYKNKLQEEAKKSEF